MHRDFPLDVDIPIKFIDRRVERLRTDPRSDLRMALNPNIHCQFSVPDLSEEDVFLVRQWCTQTSDLERNTSARKAEIIAKRFYESYGLSVRDVSITQLQTQRSSGEWKLYDLQVNDSPVDVKNYRSLRRRSSRYREHRVKHFKRTDQGLEISIAGVVSPWTNVDEIVFLGENTFSEIESVRKYFQQGDLLTLDFSGNAIHRGTLLPPWMFDYPLQCYKQRIQSLERMKNSKLFDFAQWPAWELNPFAISILLRRDVTEIPEIRTKMEDWEVEYYRELFEACRHCGVLLSVVFFATLRHFLAMLRSSYGTSAKYRPSDYRKFLYFHPEWVHPVGIHDPLGTVSVLVSTLDALWRGSHYLIKDYRDFRLDAMGILRGRKEAQKDWKTIIAYCAKCPRDPLLLSEETRHCRYGRIICECGHCCSDCK
ncbi:hypothetical protein L0156_02215 [bacterium]|nr:hypothetical protein [bacterium]